MRPTATPSTATALIGSAWDVAAALPPAEGIAHHHLVEWTQGSAVHPELAAANLQTLRGHDVLEAIAGDRLAALGGHAQQYATAPVQRLLQSLEPLTGGGWWCSGLDPLAHWAPMAWGQFKPDRPRCSTEGKPLKYEAPWGVATRSAWLRVPAAVALLVADRFGLTAPAPVLADSDGSAGAFWRWWAQTPGLPLVVTEGSKKSAALLSVGVPAVALPGVDSGAKRSGPKGFDGRRTGPLVLLPDLAGVPLKGRSVWVLFDASTKANPREPIAARRLGRLLAKRGAKVLTGVCPGTYGKGADDHLANGGTWGQLAAALRPLTVPAVLPQLRPANLTAAAGQHLGDTGSEALRDYRLVVNDGPMGCGKTFWARQAVAPYLEIGVPTLAPTHRTALGESQSEAIGIPWAAAPGTDERLQGTGLCWDSLRPSSALSIRPAEWQGPDGAGPVVVLDEIAQGIEHVLFGTGTAVADHRPETMATAAALLRSARKVLAMDAQLSEPVLQLLEALTGEQAYLIGSDHRPMAGRRVLVPQGLTARTAAEQGRAKVLELAKARRRVLVITTAQQAHAKGSAQNVATLLRRHWPEARALVVDSERPEAAELLGRDPNGVAAGHDWIIASPSITSGLSIDRPGLFDAVVVIGAGGRLSCEALAQAAARVRDPACPVWIYAPAIAPQLQIGSGSTDPADLLEHLRRCEARLLADLTEGWDPMQGASDAPWLRCWLELSAHRNRQAAAYAVTVAALLEAEGWAVEASDGAPDQALVAEAGAELQEIADEAQAAADAAVIAAPLISASEAAELDKRRRLSPAERATLQRHKLARRWGTGEAPPTPELLEADRNGQHKRLRLRWLLQSPDARQLAAQHDRRRREQLAPDGKGWAPDLVRELLSHKLAAADALGLPGWLTREGWIPADDPALIALQTTVTACSGDLRQALGVSPGKRASGTLRTLVELCGCRLESKRIKTAGRRDTYAYRVIAEPLPAGVDQTQLEAAWADQLSRPGVG